MFVLPESITHVLSIIIWSCFLLIIYHFHFYNARKSMFAKTLETVLIIVVIVGDYKLTL
jgi:hypothetical protein